MMQVVLLPVPAAMKVQATSRKEGDFFFREVKGLKIEFDDFLNPGGRLRDLVRC